MKKRKGRQRRNLEGRERKGSKLEINEENKKRRGRRNKSREKRNGEVEMKKRKRRIKMDKIWQEKEKKR